MAADGKSAITNGGGLRHWNLATGEPLKACPAKTDMHAAYARSRSPRQERACPSGWTVLLRWDTTTGRLIESRSEPGHRAV